MSEASNPAQSQWKPSEGGGWERAPHIPDTDTQPTPSANLQPEIGYLGPKRDLDPSIMALATDPSAMTDTDRAEAIKLAQREANLDSGQNRVVVKEGGSTYWASEYPNVFTFNGILRGHFETYHKDPAKRSGGEQLAGPGGDSTDVIIETDDGHSILIRRTNDRKSAAFQTFELSSTTMHMGQDGDELLTRPIDTQQLKDVVVIPGSPLVLNKDPETGKQLRTRGVVTRITSVQKDPEGMVAEGHPYAERPERIREATSRFVEAVHEARQMEVAATVGPLAVRAK